MTSSRRGGMASRLAAVAAVATLAFAGALALPALRGVDPLIAGPVDTPSVQGRERIGAWLVEANATLRPNRAFTLDVRLTRDVDAPPPDQIRPRVLVEMEGMSPFEPPLELTGAGEYRLDGVLPMSGRWTFRVGFDEGFLDLVVDIPPDLVGEPT